MFKVDLFKWSFTISIQISEQFSAHFSPKFSVAQVTILRNACNKSIFIVKFTKYITKQSKCFGRRRGVWKKYQGLLAHFAIDAAKLLSGQFGCFVLKFKCKMAKWFTAKGFNGEMVDGEKVQHQGEHTAKMHRGVPNS